MSANVESMFYAGREKPWHGLGTQVEEAPTSADALRLAGLDWTVQRKPIQVCGGRKVDNFFANVRSSDGAVLGVVSDRYQVVQNAEAFAFTDALIGEEYMICYFAPDILKFKGTAWGALNAMSDMVGHTAPRRMTSNYQENNWGRIMDGHAMMDKMASLLAGVGAR